MIKKALAIGILALGTLGFTGCANTATRMYGGTMELDLPKGQKLMTITWKENDLWYLTRPMTEEDEAETLIFQETTNFGLLEGKVIIKEHK